MLPEGFSESTLYSRYLIPDPGQTNPSASGTIGYLLLGALSVPFVWLAGVKGTVFTPFHYIRTVYQLHVVENQQKEGKGALEELQGRLKKISVQKQEIESLKKQIKQTEFDLSILQGRKEDLQIELKSNKQTLVASLLALIPVVGIVAVGVYLRATTPDIKDTGIRGGVEAIAQKVFEGSEIVNMGLYLLRGVDIKCFNENGRTQAYLQKLCKGNHICTRIASRLLGISSKDFQKIKMKELEHQKQCKTEIEDMGGQEIEIPVYRGPGQSMLQAVVIPAKSPQKPSRPFDPNKPTAVYFHGNMGIGGFCVNQADFYQQLGFNVLFVTIGGYPGSDSRIKTSEITTYQDANAVMAYLKGLGVKNVVVHGLSLGGTLAFAAAELHPDIVKFVVADQTFDKAENVGIYYVANPFEGYIPLSLIRGAIKGSLPIGRTVPGVFTLDGKIYKTNRLNNLVKAAQLKCELFAIKAENDELMGRKLGARFKYNLVENLILARYGQEERLSKGKILKKHMVTLPQASHCEWFSRNERPFPNYQLDGNKRYPLSPQALARPLRDRLWTVCFSEKLSSSRRKIRPLQAFGYPTPAEKRDLLERFMGSVQA